MKRLGVLFSIAFFALNYTFSQADNSNMVSKDIEERKVEIMPTFPGGQEELFKFLNSNVRYPRNAYKDSQQGRVITQFIVDRDGSVVSPSVLAGVSPALDREALKIIMMMPRWNPGIQDGEKVRVVFTLPVNFRFHENYEPVEYNKFGSFSGEEGLYKYLNNNIKYPESALNEGAEGMALVQFVIDKKGKVKNVSLMTSTRNPDLDKEALRLISEMPDWEPAETGNKKISIRKVLPVEFKINK